MARPVRIRVPSVPRRSGRTFGGGECQMKLMPVLFVALTIAALNSGCAGPRAAASGVQTHTLLSRGTGAPRLELDLPKGFQMRRHQGPDFDVFYFRDTKRNASLGVYV